MSVKTVGSGRDAKLVSRFIVRPNDATQFAAGEVYDTAAGVGLTFSAAARANGRAGSIVDALLVINANPATKGVFECWVFSAALGVYDVGNAVFTPTSADLGNLIGILDFSTAFIGDATVGNNGNLIYHAERTYLPLMFDTPAAADDLFGVIVVRNTYTPKAFEVLTVILKIDQM